ncbi:hypothetical protein KR009_001742 [Drosophila setifemur]|nr:hypothetical protein KR009_001742 [Drosophila setifemur]
MSSYKCGVLVVLACCLMAAVASFSVPDPEDLLVSNPEEYLENYHLIRKARSPEGGSLVLTASKDNQVGREASVQYNHNLYTSRDGRGSIDAYAQGTRNFDQNRNNYGGGIQGSWRF